MNTMDLKVRCNRWIWLPCAVAVFILLGQWRCLTIQWDFSLLDTIVEVPAALREISSGGDVAAIVGGSIGLIVLIGLYAALSAGLGWILAAIISTVLAMLHILPPATASDLDPEEKEKRNLTRLKLALWTISVFVALFLAAFILLSL